MEKYLPTGNEQISLPKLNEKNACLEDITFLHMACKGLIEIRGGDTLPLMQPFVNIDGKDMPLENIRWQRINFWIPCFSCSAGPISVEGIILSPQGERGFAFKLELHNQDQTSHCVCFGLRGCWGSTWHCVNENKKILGTPSCHESLWNDSLIFELSCGTPLFAFAPMSNDAECHSEFHIEEDGIYYQLSHSHKFEANQCRDAVIYWGLGYEEVAAATSAKEMLRQGWQYELNRTIQWLTQRSIDLNDAKLTALYNTNLFFCIFFSIGVTLDTEEFVMVTSRSPRYYVSAAYWDRDSLLWSFPAILQADTALAKKMLLYVFGRQRRNIGVHSRFIDGTVLEPGFELDELMAPVLALERYVTATGDSNLLKRPEILAGVEEILEKLAEKRHSSISLYETFLQPTDDERVYPYLTYDNVLVWRGLCALSELYPQYAHLANEANNVKKAIYTHCVKTNADGKDYFAWSVDLNGQSDVYDEPPGSLQLLPHLGFCPSDDPIYTTTVQMIRSPLYPYSFAGCPIAEIGCPHAPHPWLLSIANSLICGRVEHCLDILQRIQMDNLIACESVDEYSGECTTGEAFATCAGFLCYALRLALEGDQNHA